MKERDFIKKAIDKNIADKERIRCRALAAGNEKSVRRRFIMKKGWAIAIIVAIVCVATLTTMSAIYTPQNFNKIRPAEAKEYSDVLNAIKKFNKKENSFKFEDLFRMYSKATNDLGDSFDEAESENAGGGGDYSTTNVQTEGIDEGDIVKTDGNYIYKINTNGCFIVEANNGQLDISSAITIENYVPQELYVIGNRLIMIGGIYEEQRMQSYANIEPMIDCIGYLKYTKTDIRIYDITDKSRPELERQITVDGSYNTSRIMEENNKLFYMINYNFSYGQEKTYIPKIKDTTINNGKERNIPAEDIYIYDDIQQYSYLIVGHIDLDNPQNQSEIATYLGLGGEIYVSAENIFVATYDWNSGYDTNMFGWIKESSERVATSRIVKIGLDNLQQKAATRVDGSIKDRFSMDEYNGFLRVATTVNGKTIYNNLYVLKSDLTMAGKIEKIAEGETIYSARFNKDKGSIVTFEQVDPYFYFDLSDPYNPIITGELKEDGVSYYIHYIEGTDYTIGIGMMSEVVQNPYGEFVQWTGLKVSLYDNSTETPVNVNTYVINGSCYSEVLNKPKALLYDKDRGLIAFAYERWSYGNNYYYTSMIQGLAVFKFDLDAEDDSDKLIYRNTLTNMEEDVDVNEGWHGYYNSYRSFITRGIRIGDYIYTISDKDIISYDLENLNKINSLILQQED